MNKMKGIMFNERYGLETAVLEGRKTQTRRFKPKYKVGEIVAIKQSYKTIGENHPDPDYFLAQVARLHGCKVEDTESLAGWRNKMFVKLALMPRRIQITSVRIERLQDISHEDCLAEGVTLGEYQTPKEAFGELIDKVNGKGTWHSNPKVWVYDFKLIK